jgi:hypothetical protein
MKSTRVVSKFPALKTDFQFYCNLLREGIDEVTHHDRKLARIESSFYLPMNDYVMGEESIYSSGVMGSLRERYRSSPLHPRSQAELEAANALSSEIKRLRSFWKEVGVSKADQDWYLDEDLDELRKGLLQNLRVQRSSLFKVFEELIFLGQEGKIMVNQLQTSAEYRHLTTTLNALLG